MELRAALKTAASVAKQAAAARLLREASRPASALNTFSAMLLPRMEQGSADRDLVSGIVSQVSKVDQKAMQGMAFVTNSATADAIYEVVGEREKPATCHR